MDHKSEIEACIYKKLKDESNPCNLIERKKLTIILGRFYHFPKESRNKVIKELEDKGLIQIINKFEVKVN